MNKKLIFGVLFLFIFVIIGVLIYQNQSNFPKKEISSKPVVKMGVTLPLTGNMANVGNSIKEAVLMAKEDIPADSKYNYEIIIEDDGFENKRVALNANNFFHIRNVDAILGIFSGSTRVIAPLAERFKVPFLACAWGDSFFKDYDYAFNSYTRAKTQADAAFELLKRNNITKISVITNMAPSIFDLTEYINKMAPEKGVQILSNTAFQSGTRDFRIDIAKIKQLKPQAILLTLIPPELDIFGRQAREARLNIPFYTIDNFYFSRHLELFEGAKFVSTRIGTEDFQKRLSARTHQPVEHFEAKMYDLIKMIVYVQEKSDHKLTGEELKNALYRIKDFDSAMGIKVNVDPDGVIDSSMVEAVVKNGRIVIVNDNL